MGGDVSEQRRSRSLLASVAAGIIGAAEAVLAVSFAALVFGGLLVGNLTAGIGLFLGAAVVALAIMAWRAGDRGVVGGLQDATAAVLAIVAASTALDTFGGTDRAFLTVIGATLVVTVSCGGRLPGAWDRPARQPRPVRAVPGRGRVPGRNRLVAVQGRHLRRIGRGGAPAHDRGADRPRCSQHWLPALAFGVVLLLAVRRVPKPLVIPIVLGAGVVAFVLGMVLTGSSLGDARAGRWLLGPFESVRLWQPWTLRALSDADWSAVLGQWAGIATAVFVATIAILFNISGSEVVLHRDLDTNRELRDAGL